MFNRHDAYRFEDRAPRVFAPRVAPDPEDEQRLNEKLAKIRDRLQEDMKGRRRTQASR